MHKLKNSRVITLYIQLYAHTPHNGAIDCKINIQLCTELLRSLTICDNSFIYLRVYM